MTAEPMHVETDVLVIGSGGAGMYAAIEAARARLPRCSSLDRSLIGRGGATVMAQMTVAVALGEETPDHWSHHYDDTLDAGRGLCDERAVAAAVRGRPRVHPRDGRVGRRLGAQGRPHHRRRMAPGHDRPRCVYVDFLNTGPAVSKTLRTVTYKRTPASAAPATCCVVDLAAARRRGRRRGARWHLPSGAPVTIAAKATIVATGGLTRLYRRNSASANMGGDGYALALRAGAPLIDMEFVQFFPIGHLAPRLIGMDPIMWDPFRYKLGGRLLNRDRRGVHRPLRRAARTAATSSPATSAPTPSSRRSRPAAARRTAAPICQLPARAGGEAARGVRPGDRPAGGERHRSHQDAGRGRADRALPHGRRRRRRRRCRPRCRACWSPARRSAAPTAPTGCPATPSPRRWCSAAQAGRTAAGARQGDAPAAVPAAGGARDARPARIRGDRRRTSNTAEMLAAPASHHGGRRRPVPHRGEAQARARHASTISTQRARRRARSATAARSTCSGSTGSTCATC